MSEDDDDRWVCHHCIGEAYLKASIKAVADRQTCSFCVRKAAAIALDELAERVKRVFEEHLVPTARDMDGLEYAMHKDSEINCRWYRSGDDVATTISEMLEADESIALAVQECLSDRQSLDDQAIGEEDPYGDEAHYTGRGADDEKYQALWTDFETSLRTRSRFYNAQAKALFDEILKDIEGLTSHDGRPAVLKVLPTSFPSFYRARIAFDRKTVDRYLKEPEHELGAPPSAFAKPGRMNANGIPVFYGAFEQRTCIAELRPPVGSQIVVAKFDVMRELRLLDLDVFTTLTVDGSLFDPEHRERLDRIAFLRNLHAHVIRPTMPGEEELGYLPTQAFAEYLANGATPRFDGLMFGSTQTGSAGRNIVLFADAARLEKADAVSTSVRRAYGSPDDPFEDLSIEERSAPVSTTVERAGAHPFFEDDFEMVLAGLPWQKRNPDPLPTLRLDRDAIEVHEVRACDYRTQSITIKRVRERRD